VKKLINDQLKKTTLYYVLQMSFYYNKIVNKLTKFIVSIFENERIILIIMVEKSSIVKIECL